MSATLAPLRLHLPDLAATESLAGRIAGQLRPGDAILLEGPLGAGKSALARALIRAAAGDAALDVPSPSYTLVQEYRTAAGPLSHFDLWRLDGPGGVIELGWDDARQGIVIVEWPDRLGALTPPDALRIELSHGEGEARLAVLQGWEGPGIVMVTQAMLLAAGLGTRMRPLTERTAKPLLPLGGRPLLDHALDRLQAAGVTHVVVNTHWQAALVEQHLAHRQGGPAITLQPEPSLLDTGGAVAAALASGALKPEPFFIVNGDSLWLDGPSPALGRMLASFDPVALDGLLLMHRTFQVPGEAGSGDFSLDPWGKLRRRREREVVPYLFAGVQLATPALFANAPASPFSNNAVWDAALEAGRLRAIVHDGLWFHLSRPQDLSDAEVALHASETGETR